MTAPRTLNGYPVIGTAPRKGIGFEPGTLVVMVDRGVDAFQRYIVATWSPQMGNEWCWGFYTSHLDEACRAFIEKCAVAEVAA